jgi:hypothetical protein
MGTSGLETAPGSALLPTVVLLGAEESMLHAPSMLHFSSLPNRDIQDKEKKITRTRKIST